MLGLMELRFKDGCRLLSFNPAVLPRPPPPSRSLYVRQASEVPHPLPLQKPLNASMRFEHAHIRQLRSLAVCHAFSVWANLHGSIIPNRVTVMFEIAPVRICPSRMLADFIFILQNKTITRHWRRHCRPRPRPLA